MSSQRQSRGQITSTGNLSGSQGSNGWGKQAAKRFDTTEVFKNDPLLQRLEGKIAVDFGDYKPWQRTSFPRNALPPKPTPPRDSMKVSNRPLSSRITRSCSTAATSRAGHDNERPTSGFTIHTQCSSVCLHPWLKKPVIVPSGLFDKKKNKFLSVLRVNLPLFGKIDL